MKTLPVGDEETALYGSVGPEELLESETLNRLVQVPLESLREAHRDAVALRVDGVMSARDDSSESVVFFVEHGIPESAAALVCAESELSGYWSARRALTSLGAAHQCDDAMIALIERAVALLPIEDIASRCIEWSDENTLLQEILDSNGVHANEQTMNPPLIAFDSTFAAGVVEYDLIHHGITGDFTRSRRTR